MKKKSYFGIWIALPNLKLASCVKDKQVYFSMSHVNNILNIYIIS